MSFKLVSGVFQVKDGAAAIDGLKLENVLGPIELLPVAGSTKDKAFGRKSLPHPDLPRLGPIKDAAEGLLDALHPTQFARLELYSVDGEACMGVKLSICPTPTGFVAQPAPKIAPPIPAAPPVRNDPNAKPPAVPAKLELGGFVSKPKQ